MIDVVILTNNRYVNPEKTDWYIDQVLLEDQLLQTALEDKGLKVCKKDWTDRNFDWTKTKYAIFRTTWDYFDRFDEFFSWLDQTKNKTIVTNVEEKPKNPKSNFAIVALYRFRPSIFKALKEIRNDQKELQLTDAIQKLIDFGGNVSAILLDKNDPVIDIGTADSYLETIKKFKNA